MADRTDSIKTPGAVETRIREKLTHAFQPLRLEVVNESHMHSVPLGSETHFKVLIVADAFQGQPRVVRSRSVHQVLDAELKSGVHALSQRTLTVQEWEDQGSESFVSPPCHGGSKADKA